MFRVKVRKDQPNNNNKLATTIHKRVRLFGYVPGSSNFVVSCFNCWESTSLVQFSLRGAVLQGVLHGEVMKYESTHASHVFHFSYGHLSLTSFPSFIGQFRIKNQVIWHITMLLALWIIWKTRGNSVFNNVHIHLITMFIECLDVICPHTTWSIWWSAGFGWCSVPMAIGL